MTSYRFASGKSSVCRYGTALQTRMNLQCCAEKLDLQHTAHLREMCSGSEERELFVGGMRLTLDFLNQFQFVLIVGKGAFKRSLNLLVEDESLFLARGQ